MATAFQTDKGKAGENRRRNATGPNRASGGSPGYRTSKTSLQRRPCLISFTPSLVRRALLALLLLAVAPVAMFAAHPSNADARVVWCAGDPAVIVNGNLVDVQVHLPFDRLRDVDYVEVVFHVPADAQVLAVINDSLFFKARPRVEKDLPAQGRARLLQSTDIPVDIIVHHRGQSMDVAATGVSTGWGSRLWIQGTSDQPLHLSTSGFLGLRLFGGLF